MADSTLSLLLKGYAWLPARRRRSGGAPVRTRLLGRRAIALHGPAAARFFYDGDRVHRHAALPQPVIDTLFGQGAVHTLDGAEHRVRKAMFMRLLTDPVRVRALAEEVSAAWERAAAGWAGRPRVVLFDEAAVLLTRAVHAWAGVPLSEAESERTARDLVAMVDGFATPGPRHFRARRARRRQEVRVARLIGRERAAAGAGPDDGAAKGESPFRVVALHREADGTPLDPRTAAVEVLNVLRPTVAVSWFVAFAAHALHRHPEHRAPLAADEPGYSHRFAQEVRRFYPFAPFVGGLAAERLEWLGRPIAPGTLVLLDLYGQNHDPDFWPRPYTFDPARFAEGPTRRDELVPQGGGDPWTGHRCPGEDITLTVLATVSVLLARLSYRTVEQDLRIPLHRIPTAPRSGFVLADVR
ncbi:cytochrome P450 [Streptomyces sp. NBC_01754]|uniref:cytochrome P450 n=1 Tax=Streptomyces sp. NBC_01754 TaxID=2975930 RepID=UPI002DDB2C8A|nr:cytochrome P450 [Streptomyces sp. NBC_01754]WSC96188.1 cytochrome P450 [Streptomyces sp. NBC_01754]